MDAQTHIRLGDHGFVWLAKGNRIDGSDPSEDLRPAPCLVTAVRPGRLDLIVFHARSIDFAWDIEVAAGPRLNAFTTTLTPDEVIPSSKGRRRAATEEAMAADADRRAQAAAEAQRRLHGD